MPLPGPYVLSQVLGLVHRESFARIFRRYDADYRSRSFSSRQHFAALAFAHLTARESLRDIVTCLNSVPGRRYHLGFASPLARSTLSDASDHRDWRPYADLAALLLRQARALYASDPLELGLSESVYALDASVIDLGVGLCPWARFQPAGDAIKLHTQLDLRGPIPSFLRVSGASEADVAFLDRVVPEPGSFYVMDRGYLDFRRLHRFQEAGAWFVVRARRGLRLRRKRSFPVDRSLGLRADQLCRPATDLSRRNYPSALRRVVVFDTETRRRLSFLTNCMDLPAKTVAELHRLRWRVELFFKWIKGHLKIRSFYGNGRNAVFSQIWIAVCVYALVAIIRRRMAPHLTLHETMQVLAVNAFEQTPLAQLLAKAPPTPTTLYNNNSNPNQLNLNGF
jgi:hypothetical protein